MQFFKYIDNTRWSWAHHINKYLAKLQFYENRNSPCFCWRWGIIWFANIKIFFKEIYKQKNHYNAWTVVLKPDVSCHSYSVTHADC